MGNFIVSGKGKAKIDGAAKAVKEIEASNPNDMAFIGLGALTADFDYGRAGMASGANDADAIVSVSTKRI